MLDDVAVLFRRPLRGAELPRGQRLIPQSSHKKGVIRDADFSCTRTLDNGVVDELVVAGK